MPDSPLLTPEAEPTLPFPPVKPAPNAHKRKAPNTVADPDPEPELKSEASKKSRADKGGKKVVPGASMTADVKEALVEHIIRAALGAINKDYLASELGITKKQLDNAICSGRTNLRSKLIKAAREL